MVVVSEFMVVHSGSPNLDERRKRIGGDAPVSPLAG